MEFNFKTEQLNIMFVSSIIDSFTLKNKNRPIRLLISNNDYSVLALATENFRELFAVNFNIRIIRSDDVESKTIELY